MSRPRTIALAITCLAATALSGCGGADTEGPSGTGVSGTRATSNIPDDRGSIGELFGISDGGAASGVSGDRSISDSIPASYSDVPGSPSYTSLGSTTSLDGDTDIDVPFSSALGDGSINDSLTDLSFNDGIDLDANTSLTSLTDGMSYDNAQQDAEEKYNAGDAGIEPEFDPDMQFDPELGM